MKNNMKNKLAVNINKPEKKIKLQDNIFSIGSCFSNELSLVMKKKGVDVFSNPFGTVYNTFSIYSIIKKIFSADLYTQNDLQNENNTFFTLEHSAKFDCKSVSEIINKINRNLRETREKINNTNIFIITLGTSVVYEYKNKIIANCHKLPDKLFSKKILNINKNAEYLKKSIDIIKSNSKSPAIIFTLSPVRHTPANLVENSYSKSILRACIEEVVDNKTVYYFPSYEILLDELRNYSFYKKDGVHLKSSTAKYVIEKFISNYFSSDIKNYINNFNKIKLMLSHKIKDTSTENTFQLLIKIIDKITDLEKLKKTQLTESLKIKIVIKIIDNCPEKKEIIKELLTKISFDDNGIITFFTVMLEKNYDKIKALETENKVLKKYKDKMLYKLYLKDTI